MTVNLGAKVKAAVEAKLRGHLASPAAHRRFAEVADAGYKRVSRGRRARRRTVDGVDDQDVRLANLVGGRVIYYFGADLGTVAREALREAYRRSPVESGAYSEAWVVLVNNRPWSRALADIPAESVVTVTNIAPYARRLEQGYRRGRRGRKITEQVANALRKTFPSLSISRTFVPLPPRASAVKGWEVPYVLRRPPGGVVLYPAVEIRDR